MQTAHELAALSLAALAIYAASLVALHLLPTGFSPLRDPVSLYADGRYGALYALALAAAGACALGMAAALVLIRAPLPSRWQRRRMGHRGAVSDLGPHYGK